MMPALAFILSCALTQTQDSSAVHSPCEEILRADRQFSNVSQAKGPLEAFLAFLTDDAYLLHPNANPVRGNEAIREQFAGFPADASLTWAPTDARCSPDGSMGYTIGTYESKGKNLDGSARIRRGTYLTIWKRQRDGTIKAIADMGSPRPMPLDSTGVVLKRIPLHEETAAGRDFGLSFGTFERTTRSNDGKEIVHYGKYALVWQKQKDGSRVILADMQNESPAPSPSK